MILKKISERGIEVNGTFNQNIDNFL